MKGTGKVCIRILCAIFVGVVLGCSGGASDGGIGDGGSTGGNGGGGTDPTADICGLVHEDLQHPAYMNVTTDFGGQRFVESNAAWYSDNQDDKTTKFIERYDDANKYIDCKVAELNKLWQEKDTGSTLSNQIGIALSNFNNKTTISQNIDNNYTSLAPVFNKMQNIFIDDDDIKNFHRFNVSYQKLAADAFNQSIGGYAINDSNKRRFTTNSEMTQNDQFFASELNKADLNYQDATDSTNAKTRMNNYLNTIATRTNTNVTVLKKFVELALYNESLYGLNDFAVMCNVNNQGLTNTQRGLDIFYTKIDDATYSVSNIQNIDDRTM